LPTGGSMSRVLWAWTRVESCGRRFSPTPTATGPVARPVGPGGQAWGGPGSGRPGRQARGRRCRQSSLGGRLLRQENLHRAARALGDCAARIAEHVAFQGVQEG